MVKWLVLLAGLLAGPAQACDLNAIRVVIALADPDPFTLFAVPLVMDYCARDDVCRLKRATRNAKARKREVARARAALQCLEARHAD